MKQVLSVIAVIMFAPSAQAKIWRVNNIAGITADSTIAQAANGGVARAYSYN